MSKKNNTPLAFDIDMSKLREAPVEENISSLKRKRIRTGAKPGPQKLTGHNWVKVAFKMDPELKKEMQKAIIDGAAPSQDIFINEAIKAYLKSK